VQQAYTYQAIEFGRRGIIPNTSAKTLHLKYGDCKDHALLLRQLLAGVGIPAHLTLVNASGVVVHELPSLDQFDHMIVYVPGQSFDASARPTDGLFIDCTSKSAPPLAFPPIGLNDTSMLVLDPARPRLIHTPDYAPDFGTLHIHRNVTIVRDRSQRNAFTAEVRETVTFNPNLAAAIRGMLKSVEAGKRQGVLQEVLSSNDKIRVRKLTLDRLEETDQSLGVSLDYVMLDAFHSVVSKTETGTLVGRIPAPWEDLLLQPDYVENRQTPFEVKMPVLTTATVELSLPPGYQVADLERLNGSSQTLFAAWVSRAAQNGSNVTIQLSVRLPAGRHAAAEYDNYYSSVKDSLAVFQSPITLFAQSSIYTSEAGATPRK
jgi:hypothetical protein